MKSEAYTNPDLSETSYRSDVGKLVLEGMMTVFIVLIFLFIAQNWVLKNTDDTPFAPTCSLTESRVWTGGSVPYEANKTID